MGVREDLLVAAKRCLAERGFGGTTVRDIVAASQTNLAAINYHYGSKDALLNLAMIESTAEAVDKIIEAADAAAAVDSPEVFWAGLTQSFTKHRDLWIANIEILAQALHRPDLLEQLAAGHERARGNLANISGTTTDEPNRQVGSVQLTLLVGLLVQWLIDPEHAPTADDLAEGLFALVATLRTGEAKHHPMS